MSLYDLSRILDEHSRLKAEEHKTLNDRLGEPMAFVSDMDDPHFGIGYWKAEGGVVSYQKYANGYDPRSRMEYSDELIDMLNAIRKGQIK